MSMILEALRKSEAERQRGRAPGLFVEQRPARARERRIPAWTVVLVGLLVAVVLAWGWREWRRPAVVVVAQAAPSADVVAEARPSPPAPRTEPAPGEPGSLAPVTPAPAAAPPASTTPASAPPPAAATTPPPAAIATAEPTLATPAAPAPGVPDARLPAPSEAIGAPPIQPTAPATAAPADVLPGLGALSATDRAALPPLKLSMHVYADAPAQRFVILDGQRLGEGASPAGGVVLEEIRRDGLVLSVNGQRLLLARP